VVVVEDGGAILRDGRVIGFVTVAEVSTIREALAALEVLECDDGGCM